MPHTAQRIARLLLAGLLVATGLAGVFIPPSLPSADATDEIIGGETSAFRAVGPLRLADTRNADCGCERLDAHTIRVRIADRIGPGPAAESVAITVTATGAAADGFVTAFPAGTPLPDTSTLNMRSNADASNATIVPVGADGAIDIYASIAADMIVDVTGAFSSTTSATSGRLVTTVPKRLLDTRSMSAGGLDPGTDITVALPAGVDDDAAAMVVNVTSVGARGPGYLSAHAAGASPSATSFSNPDGTGAAVAATAILPVSPQGLTITSSAGGQIVVDLVGWFTGPSAPTSGDGLFVPVAPVRVLDTRLSAPRLWPGGSRELAVPVTGAAAIVTNLTIADADGAGFITAYPAGQDRPATSSLNAARRDAVTPNAAITATSVRGVAYFSSAGTDLIVDLAGYFTGSAVAAPLEPAADIAPVPRVLMIGDSTLEGLVDVNRAQSALRGFTWVLDARSCRRLYRPSCTSNFTPVAPNTAVDAINGSVGPFDIVVIKAGYNDLARDFDISLQQVVDAARRKGASQIIWLTYSESTTVGSYNIRNATLRQVAGGATYPDLVVADWRTYASRASGWYAPDRVHLQTIGVWATADYIARWVAHVSRLPCPLPWAPGSAPEARCSNPDDIAATTATVPDLHGLYGI
jgi:hypothetical protein